MSVVDNLGEMLKNLMNSSNNGSEVWYLDMYFKNVAQFKYYTYWSHVIDFY